MEQTYDIAVIGGGPAGYVAAIRGTQLGARVVLFERDTVGGTCLNRGCIPTKTYLKTAEYMDYIKTASNRGVCIDGGSSVDMRKAAEYKDGVVRTLTGGVRTLLKNNKVDVVAGSAVIASENSVECAGKEYFAHNILICSGSAPSLPRISGIDGRDVITSTELLNTTECPKRLCIIGGGVIGCEMACAFQGLGAEVTVIEMADRLLPMFEDEISAEIAGKLKKSGTKLLLGTEVERIETRENYSAVFTDKEEIYCDKILAAVGRKPELDCLGAIAGKIKLEKGFIVVNEYLETSVPHIYACGDVNGRLMLTNAAFYMGRLAAENCMGARTRCRLHRAPSSAYTIPEIATVGLTEKKARELYGEDVSVGRFKMASNGRALAYGEKDGFVKVVADKTTGELLGVHIVGPMANEIINEASAVMESEMTVKQVGDKLVHPHPSFSEAFYEACLDAQSLGIHSMPKKRESDRRSYELLYRH